MSCASTFRCARLLLVYYIFRVDGVRKRAQGFLWRPGGTVWKDGFEGEGVGVGVEYYELGSSLEGVAVSAVACCAAVGEDDAVLYEMKVVAMAVADETPADDSCPFETFEDAAIVSPV